VTWRTMGLLRVRPMTADSSFVPRGTEQAFREVEPFLGFRQLLLEPLDLALECVEPRCGRTG